MLKFLLYLIESGLCISILFLIYLFLFKKETFFQFNRVYLISIVVISSIIPLFHFDLTLQNGSSYESYFDKIGQIKTSYVQVFEGNYTQEPSIINLENRNSNIESEFVSLSSSNETSTLKSTSQIRNWNLISVAFSIYTFGILFLLTRFILLFTWIYKTYRTSNKEKLNNYTIVDVQKDISPFSIFKYIFLSKENIDTNQLDQIIDHEKIHINQHHSFDLILFQLVCIMHWYNPIVWIMLKAVKTNHEFIADNEVISEGYNMLDYQELLLNQFITFPTIKVVNNLNLTSIKDRIKMMNKFKSGNFAKIKTVLVIPVALFVFLIFSNLTIRKTNNNDFSLIQGMWTNESDNSFGKYLLFDSLKFSILEDYSTLREYPYQISENKIVLSLPKNEEAILKFELNDNKLKVWWGNSESSVFNKSEYNNTLDDFISQYGLKLQLPSLNNYVVLNRPELCINVIITDNKYLVNGKETSTDNLKSVLQREKENMNTLYKSLITVCIYSDIHTPMNMISDLKQALRGSDLLKISYMGIAFDNKVSKLETRFVGTPRKLPPLIGMKTAEVIEIVPDSVNVK